MIVPLAAPRVFPQEPAKSNAADSAADPDNKRVRVARVSIAPGQETSLPVLSNESLVICLRGESLTRTPLTGPEEKWAQGPGNIIWNRSATVYSIANTGETPAELLVIELKDSYAIAQLRVPWSERDSVNLDPRHFRVALENEHVRVLQMRLNPREGTMESQFPDRLEISLQDTHLSDVDIDGKSHELRRNAGSVTWEKARLHSTVNLDDQPLDNLIVELKHPFCYELAEGLGEWKGPEPGMKAYMNKVSDEVKKKWLKNMARAAREGEKGLIHLQFTIQADGSVPEDSLRFRTLFADDSLMEKALAAVREAGPFPPFPPDFQKPLVTSAFYFMYNLPRQPPGCR
jgi:hypothetical protein